jgi:hypothetical protein
MSHMRPPSRILLPQQPLEHQPYVRHRRNPCRRLQPRKEIAALPSGYGGPRINQLYTHPCLHQRHNMLLKTICKRVGDEAVQSHAHPLRSCFRMMRYEER